MPEHENQPLDRIWQYLKEHDADISSVKQTTGELRIGLNANNEKLDAVGATVSRIEAAVHRPPEKPDYKGIVAVGISALAVMGGAIAAFTMLVVTSSSNMSAYADSKQDAMLARLVARMDEADSDRDKAWERELAAAKEAGKREERLVSLRRDVDQQYTMFKSKDDKRDEWALEVQSRLSNAETGMRAEGDYLKEHANSPGHVNHNHPLNTPYFDTDAPGAGD